MEILSLSHMKKSFGRTAIIQDISFSIPENCIFGFIGQNGAGKTTTMKMILGLLAADEGEIRVCDKKVRYGQNDTNRYVGYLSDVPEFYDFMTPEEYLLLCGDITGMSRKESLQRAKELLEMVGLEENRKRIAGFSRGMKQRLGIAQALFHKPKLLICDEPTSALDPLGRKEVLDILVRAKEETTVLFSTHILSDVERICDKVAFLHGGKIVLQGDMEEIKGKHTQRPVEVEFYRQEEMERFQKQYPGGTQMHSLKLCYERKSNQDMLEMMRYLTEHQICPKRLERADSNLEDLFMEVVGA